MRRRRGGTAGFLVFIVWDYSCVLGHLQYWIYNILVHEVWSDTLRIKAKCFTNYLLRSAEFYTIHRLYYTYVRT